MGNVKISWEAEDITAALKLIEEAYEEVLFAAHSYSRVLGKESVCSTKENNNKTRND